MDVDCNEPPAPKVVLVLPINICCPAAWVILSVLPFDTTIASNTSPTAEVVGSARFIEPTELIKYPLLTAAVWLAVITDHGNRLEGDKAVTPNCDVLLLIVTSCALDTVLPLMHCK